MLKSVLSGLILTVLSVLALSGAVISDAHAQDAPPAVEVYGAAPEVELMELSPSGESIALIAVVGETRAIVVSSMATGQPIFRATVGEIKVRDLRWIGEARVLVVTSQSRSIPSLGVPLSELYFGQIVDLQKKKLVQVFNNTPDVLAVLYGGPSVRQTPQGEALFARGVNLTSDQINLHRIDLNTGRGRPVKVMTRETADYVLDGQGEVIAMARYVERSGRWTLMLPRGHGFYEAWATDALIDPPVLLGMGRTPRTILVGADRPDLAEQDPDADTPDVVFEVNVDTGAWSRLPFVHHPDVLIHHTATRLLLGASRQEEDGTRYEFLDPQSARRWAAIEKAFAGKAPRLVSWNDDQTLALVSTDKTESGVYQLVNFERRTADILAQSYPQIADAHVGAMRPIQYAAADGLEIPGYLTLPPGVSTPEKLPLIVLAHGGPASRDVMGFDWWAQALASRGYAVLQPNFRGSDGYTRAFM
jgi:hypothetical protein